MEYVLTAAQMKECDRAASSRFGMPSLVLMERAAMACAEVIIQRDERIRAALKNEASFGRGPVTAGRRTLIIAGSGNNGGDGFAIGRLLAQKGFPVDFVLVGNREKCTPETGQQIRILENYGFVIGDALPDREYDIIVDALFGIGLHSGLSGRYAQAVEYMNRQEAYVLAVDIPSGIHADTGQVCGCAVAADVTVTFAFCKLGLLLYPGTEYAGQVIRKDIGITEDGFAGSNPQLFTFTEAPGQLLPARRRDGNKGTFGKVLLAAGCRGMAGAAVLSAQAVLHGGAGMVRVITDETNREILQTSLPEAMFASDEEEETLADAMDWSDVIAAGPGMGTGERARGMLENILEKSTGPLVLDADALNILSENRHMLSRLEKLQKSRPRPLVCTPHPGELARLAGMKTAQVLEDPFHVSREWAQKLQAAFLCKGFRTVVADPGGNCYINRSGNSGMATAGSGDVLTGIIAALLAQGMGAFDAACVGVYLHGCAGDGAAHRKNEYSITAADLVAELDELMKTTGKE